jgi:hypothetical protein
MTGRRAILAWPAMIASGTKEKTVARTAQASPGVLV